MFDQHELPSTNISYDCDTEDKISDCNNDDSMHIFNSDNVLHRSSGVIVNPFRNDIFVNFSNYENLYEFRSDFRLKDTALNDYKTVRLNISDISKYVQGGAVVDIDGVEFNTFLFKSSVKKLYVSLTSGTRKKDQNTLFTRWKWRRYFKGNFLLIDDPMFAYISDFPKNIMGWFYGTTDNNFLDKTAGLIKEIAKSLDVKVQDITLIGSSSGGTASLYISNKLDGCMSIAFNPQLSLVDWPYAKDFERITGVNLSAHDERNRITINPESQSKHFIYYNLISDSDRVQMSFLLNSMGLCNFKVKNGINKLSDSIYLLASVTNTHKRHTTAPNEYETSIISEFLSMNSEEREQFVRSEFFTYMAENISKRFELLNNVYRVKKEKLLISSQYLDYAKRTFEQDLKLNNYESLLTDYKSLFALETFNLPNSYFKNVVLSLKKLNYSRQQISEFFGSCVSSSITIITNIADKIKNGKFDVQRVVSEFGDVIENLYTSSSVVSCYKEAFSYICCAISENKVPNFVIDDHVNVNYAILSERIESKDLDFIEKLNTSNCFLVKQKCDLIGFNRGLAGFINNLDSKDSLIAQTIDFFFKNLIGYYSFKSVARFKQIHAAYNYSHRLGAQIEYAKKVKQISILLANIIVAKEPQKMINSLVLYMIELIVVGMGLPKDKYLVFEKLTHEGMECCVDYVHFIHKDKLDFLKHDS